MKRAAAKAEWKKADDPDADYAAVVAQANALQQQAEQLNADYTDLAFGKQAQGKTSYIPLLIDCLDNDRAAVGVHSATLPIHFFAHSICALPSFDHRLFVPF